MYTPPINGARARLRDLPAHVERLVADQQPAPVPANDVPRHVQKITGRISGNTNRVFYVVVLGIALTGAGLAAAKWLQWYEPFAFAAVAAVELGGVALSVHADERRRLGERAIVARLLSATVAAGAVAVNWFGHKDHVGQAAFFAGMSALGYMVWLIDSGARRRDALRASGDLRRTAPVYGPVQWIRHPGLTRRARLLALADRSLGRSGSLDAARRAVKAERRQAAIAQALRSRITEHVGPVQAEIVIHTYDLDEVARRLEEDADYDGLTDLIGRDLVPAKVAPPPPPPAVEVPAWRRALVPAEGAVVVPPAETPDVPVAAAPEVPPAAPAGTSAPRAAGTSARKQAGTRGRKKVPEVRPRRTPEETRKLAAELLTVEPHLKQAEVAARLGISDRQLRNALNTQTSDTPPKETP
jgi:hypothetical protein